MTPTTGRRLDALEQAGGPSERIRLIVRQIVSPEFPDAQATRIDASDHLPAVDRRAGESWEQFVQGLLGMVENLPGAPVVRLIARMSAMRPVPAALEKHLGLYHDNAPARSVLPIVINLA